MEKEITACAEKSIRRLPQAPASSSLPVAAIDDLRGAVDAFFQHADAPASRAARAVAALRSLRHRHFARLLVALGGQRRIDDIADRHQRAGVFVHLPIS